MAPTTSPGECLSSRLAADCIGTVRGMPHAIPLMKKGSRGRVVNISSISGVRASAGRMAYGTSKAAMIGLTRQLAIELAGDNITVNSVAPGPVDTATARAVHTELTRASYLRLIPMRRYGRPRRSPPQCPSSAQRTRRTSPVTRFRSTVAFLRPVSLRFDMSLHEASLAIRQHESDRIRCRTVVSWAGCFFQPRSRTIEFFENRPSSGNSRHSTPTPSRSPQRRR
jgi:short-subunit dehydrogenase